MWLFSVSIRVTQSTESIQVRGRLWHFKTSLFVWWGVVSPTPNPQAGWPPHVGCRRLLIRYIRIYPPNLEAVSSIRNLKTRHDVVTRDPCRETARVAARLKISQERFSSMKLVWGTSILCQLLRLRMCSAECSWITDREKRVVAHFKVSIHKLRGWSDKYVCESVLWYTSSVKNFIYLVSFNCFHADFSPFTNLEYRNVIRNKLTQPARQRASVT
jgi:hypothetical protein